MEWCCLQTTVVQEGFPDHPVYQVPGENQDVSVRLSIYPTTSKISAVFTITGFIDKSLTNRNKWHWNSETWRTHFMNWLDPRYIWLCLSVCLSLSLSVSPSLSFSFLLSLPVSLYVSLSLRLSPSIALSVTIYFMYLPLSVSVSLLIELPLCKRTLLSTGFWW